ncbi:MAG: dTDP-4-dehydrorhamnose reductase [Bauldia sp.]|nr:dTDP-4-dehydrorhamnose reductase [Bauldia sp.]
MTPRILVVGSSGQLGTALRRLGDPAITCAGRPVIDVMRPDTIMAAVAAARPDVVVNASAFTAVDAAEADEAGALDVNARGAALLAAAAGEAGAPIIHVSTDYVFAGDKGSPYLEDDATGPLTAYGRSKLAGEGTVARANPRHVIVRTSWLFGTSDRTFVASVLRLARERERIEMVADQLGSPTFAGDLAAALVAMATDIAGREDYDWGVRHVAGAHASRFEFAEAVLDAAAAHGMSRPELVPTRLASFKAAAPRPLDTRLDSRFPGGRTRSFREAVPALVAELIARQSAG